MFINQISVFLENRAGRMAEVTRILADNGVNINALNLADTSDFGILRIITDNPAHGEKVLKEAGFTATQSEVIAVAMNDKPGGLAEILELLQEKEIAVEYLYAFKAREMGKALVIIKVENAVGAAEVLDKHDALFLQPGDIF